MNCQWLAAAALLAVASPASAQRPMSLQDLLGAVRVSDPQVSPDGRTVAYVRTTTDVESGARNADIWIVAADGSSAPKLLVGGAKSENTPRWSPDGRSIAFISTRDGAPNVYLADAAGGNVRAVTKMAGGVQPPLVFSPDGATLAFVSDVKQEPGPADNVHRVTRLLYRHWDEWRENVRHHVFAAAVNGGEPQPWVDGFTLAVSEPVWAPDGTRFAALVADPTVTDPEIEPAKPGMYSIAQPFMDLHVGQADGA